MAIQVLGVSLFMHAQRMVQLAHLVAKQSASLTVINGEQLDGTLGQYWATSKCRIQNWQDELARLESSIRKGESDQHPSFWARSAPIASEILFANILTSVATATVLAVPQAGDELSPIVRGVLDSERDARKRLEVMLELACDRNLRQRRHIAVLAELATSCKQSAIWTDLMLGFFSNPANAASCGLVPDRVQLNHANCHSLKQTGKLTTLHTKIDSDIETYFSTYTIKPSSIGHLNAQIGRTLQLAFGMVRPRPMPLLTVGNEAPTSKLVPRA